MKEPLGSYSQSSQYSACPGCHQAGAGKDFGIRNFVSQILLDQNFTDLDGFRQGVEKAFPNARSFVRPGFDSMAK